MKLRSFFSKVFAGVLAGAGAVLLKPGPSYFSHTRGVLKFTENTFVADRWKVDQGLILRQYVRSVTGDAALADRLVPRKPTT